jgi:hypothetical protein
VAAKLDGGAAVSLFRGEPPSVETRNPNRLSLLPFLSSREWGIWPNLRGEWMMAIEAVPYRLRCIYIY